MSADVTVKWTEGRQFVARAGDGPGVVIDSHDGGSGPSPMELVLMGVAGCTAIDVVSILEKKRIHPRKFYVNISGARAEHLPRRFTHLSIEYVLHGTGIAPAAVEQAIKLSETKYCSALTSLNASVEHAYRIEE